MRSNELFNKSFRWVMIALGLLLIPLVAMQFTDEVNWNLSDFLVMGGLITGLGILYEWLSMKSGQKVYRYAAATGLLAAFLLVWVNGAVGIIGSEDNPANALFGTVFIVLLAGAFISRFRPRGMAVTLFAASITIMLIPAIALLFWPPPGTSWSPGILGVFMMTGFFAVLFCLSALLFRHSDSGPEFQKPVPQ